MSQDMSVTTQSDDKRMSFKEQSTQWFLSFFTDGEIRKLIRVLLMEFGHRISAPDFRVMGELLSKPWGKLNGETAGIHLICRVVNLINHGVCRYPFHSTHLISSDVEEFVRDTKKLLADRADSFFPVIYRHDVGLVTVTLHAWERFFERHLGLSPKTARDYYGSEETLYVIQDFFWNVRPALLHGRQRWQHYHGGQPVHFLQGSEERLRFVVTVALPKHLVTIEKMK